ncbi:MAG TPA: phosphoglycerate mutase family protein [Patescibacteria group bacterium]|nr:phosphoglycerate mutase family protein [Patescibacteria group bacterium]
MFALIRHAGYHFNSGSLTETGSQKAILLAERLKTDDVRWKDILSAPSARTRETALLVSKTLTIPYRIDTRLEPGQNLVSFFPPNNLEETIFVSHLPVITKILRVWSRFLKIPEPPLVEVANGYIVDPDQKTIQPIYETGA